MVALVMWMCRAAKKCDGAAGAAEVPLVSPDKSCHLRVGSVLCDIDKKPCRLRVILFLLLKADFRCRSQTLLLSLLQLYLAAAAAIAVGLEVSILVGSGAPLRTLLLKLQRFLWSVAEAVAHSTTVDSTYVARVINITPSVCSH